MILQELFSTKKRWIYESDRVGVGRYLHGGVEEGHSVQQRLPLRQVADL